MEHTPKQDTDMLPDITQTDLRAQLLVEGAFNREDFLRLKEKTPARLGVGRAGARYKTQTMLRMRADHAAAQDSVFSDVAPDFIEKNGFVFVKTRCADKDEYLTRPDLGRRFDEPELKIIRETCGENPEVLLVVGDGLSSAAIEANAEDTLPAIRQGLEMHGIKTGAVLFVKHCRVGAMDHIGQVTGAQVVCLLVGERPGLSSAQSMSAYIAYRPHLGMEEHNRTVVSNIHKNGTPAVEAGAHIAGLIHTMLRFQASGVVLRRLMQGADGGASR